jgi:transposase
VTLTQKLCAGIAGWLPSPRPAVADAEGVSPWVVHAGWRVLKDGARIVGRPNYRDLITAARFVYAVRVRGQLSPVVRELRETVRHRTKLVALRSHCKAQVHAVLANCGVAVPMSDLLGVGGTELLNRLELPKPYAARIASPRRVMDARDFEIDICYKLARGRLARDPGYTAVQTIPGIGLILGAVFVAEIGDVHRFPSADKLSCWAGMTPKHHESDTKVRRGRITKQGSRLVRWAAVESVQRLPNGRGCWAVPRPPCSTPGDRGSAAPRSAAPAGSAGRRW